MTCGEQINKAKSIAFINQLKQSIHFRGFTDLSYVLRGKKTFFEIEIIVREVGSLGYCQILF